MKSVSVDMLKPGLILARTVINDDMVVILSENTLLTKAHITRVGGTVEELVDARMSMSSVQTTRALKRCSTAVTLLPASIMKL